MAKNKNKPKKATVKEESGAVCSVDSPQDEEIIDQLPDEVKKQLQKDGVPLEKVKFMAMRGGLASFSSQYPPPEVIEGYKKVDPRLVDTIIEHTMDEQKHRHAMDNVDADLRKKQQDFQRRGQTITSWLVPLLVILVGGVTFLIMDDQNRLEFFKYYLYFVFGIAVLVATGRVVSGFENIFGQKNARNK